MNENQSNPSGESCAAGDSNAYQAEWKPGWHELDQELAVGQTAEFQFAGASEPSLDSEATLSFYNDLAGEKPTHQRTATVVQIEHADLGPIERIECRGLDYRFVPCAGSEIVVNAEEHPGRAVDESVTISDWSVIVTLVDAPDAPNDIA